MNIIELAKKCGFDISEGEVLVGDYGNVNTITKELEAFATAIIENYKAGLVPVAYEFKGRYFDPDQIADESLCTKLYELRETK
jgi:hypothetical protein